LVFDRTCSSIEDIHSLCALPDFLVAVSSGTDEIVRLPLRAGELGPEEVIWRISTDAGRSDNHHLNSICSWRGGLVVSGFGPKPDGTWRSAREGFLQNIDTGERLVTAVRHPHSATPVGDTLSYCESATASVRVVGTQTSSPVLPGYT